jgi:hypothetical protein
MLTRISPQPRSSVNLTRRAIRPSGIDLGGSPRIMIEWTRKPRWMNSINAEIPVERAAGARYSLRALTVHRCENYCGTGGPYLLPYLISISFVVLPYSRRCSQAPGSDVRLLLTQGVIHGHADTYRGSAGGSIPP